jgi:hypothetical protein
MQVHEVGFHTFLIPNPLSFFLLSLSLRGERHALERGETGVALS